MGPVHAEEVSVRTAAAAGGARHGQRAGHQCARTVVVIPTYNEAKNLPRLVKALETLELPDLWILVVDDNSPDGTGQIAEELRTSYPKIEIIHRAGKLGLGTAYVEGFQRALEMGAEYVVQMDADLSHEPGRIPLMLEAAQDADVVIGSRYIEGGELDPGWGRLRVLLSGWANLYARTILAAEQRDMTGGFRCWSRSAVERLDFATINSNGYAIQIELAYRCQRLGLRVQEIPIHFYERDGGVSKMSSRVMLEAAWRVWQLRLRPWRPADRP